MQQHQLSEKIDQMVARIRAIKSLQNEVAVLEREVGETLGQGDYTHGGALLRIRRKGGRDFYQWRVEVIEGKQI